MASVHVPFAIDGRPLARYRGELSVDGSFSEFFTPDLPSYGPFFDEQTQARGSGLRPGGPARAVSHLPRLHRG